MCSVGSCAFRNGVGDTRFCCHAKGLCGASWEGWSRPGIEEGWQHLALCVLGKGFGTWKPEGAERDFLIHTSSCVNRVYDSEWGREAEMLGLAWLVSCELA